MLESMPEHVNPKEVILEEEKDLADSSPEVPTALIPACGTLCDAFWWARRSAPKLPTR